MKSLLYLINRFLLGRKYLIGHSPKYGVKLKFRTQDGGGRAIYKKGLYEEELTSHLVNNLQISKGDTILDVGGNIGWYSVVLGKTFAEGKIFTFEPEPDNFACLKHNLESNRMVNVNAVNKGASDKTETKTLFLYKKSNVGRHSMLNINEGPTMEVKTVRLDDFIQEQKVDIESIKFLKIDIEGFEYFAFKGAEKLLKNIPLILAEFSPGYMRQGGIEPSELLELLRSHGYSPNVVKDGELQPIDDEQLLTRNNNINLFWTK